MPTQRIKQTQAETHDEDFGALGTQMTPQSFREENVSHTEGQEPEMASDFSTTTVGALASQIIIQVYR